MRKSLVAALVLVATTVAAQQPPINPRQQPGANVHIFAPDQHDLYDGQFRISANRIYMVGGLNDPEGWDHLDNDAKNVKPVSGTAEIAGTSSAPARTAASSLTSTSTAPIPDAATTTGRRRSASWPAGDMAARR
jgi:hypothetical protein